MLEDHSECDETTTSSLTEEVAGLNAVVDACDVYVRLDFLKCVGSIILNKYFVYMFYDIYILSFYLNL